MPMSPTRFLGTAGPPSRKAGLWRSRAPDSGANGECRPDLRVAQTPRAALAESLAMRGPEHGLTVLVAHVRRWFHY